MGFFVNVIQGNDVVKLSDGGILLCLDFFSNVPCRLPAMIVPPKETM